MTTFVTLATVVPITEALVVMYKLTIYSGMVKVVDHLIHVALFTTCVVTAHHGLSTT